MTGQQMFNDPAPEVTRAERIDMKKFMVYMDDGNDCFKLAIPAKNEKEARKYVQGNGEVIAVKDVTEDFPISAEKVAHALGKAQFVQIEIDLITRCLQTCNIAE